MTEKRSPNYRWYILALTMLTFGVIGGASRLCMPVLFKQISDDLGLSMVAIGAVWGMDPLAGVFIGFSAGLLTDRFGVKRTMMVACILAGVFGALRGLSIDFVTMAGTMFLFGLMVAAMPTIAPKVTVEWFSERRLGMANGLLFMALYIGSMIATMFSATVFSPWLGGWRNVMFFYGAPSVLLGFLWLFTAREPPARELPDISTSRVPFRQALSRVARMKDVWLIGIISLSNAGANLGFLGYLPIYLRNIGWTPINADGAITVLTGVTSLGIIPLSLLSDKLKKRKGILFLSIASLAVSLALLPFVDTTGVWIILVIGGFLRGCSIPLLNVIVLEINGIGSTYGGTAIGLVNTIAMLGAFMAPPLGNSLEAINQGLPFIFWAGLAALGLPLMFLIRSRRGH